MADCKRSNIPQVCVLLGALAVMPATARPQETSAPAPNPIQQLAWLVGGTWTTREQASDGAPPLEVRLDCRWSGTKNAILFDVSFFSAGRETPQYDGMYVWHPGKGKFVLWQVNRKGEVAEGELVLNGKEMDQTARVSHPDGSAHFLKAHYTRLDDNSFRFKAFFRLAESDAWQDALDVVYKRSPSP
jgi:hypothetical protein